MLGEKKGCRCTVQSIGYDMSMLGFVNNYVVIERLNKCVVRDWENQSSEEACVRYDITRA